LTVFSWGKRVKSGKIAQSLDWIDQGGLEMAGTVIGELDFVRSIYLFSDKFTLGEIKKLDFDYAEDLDKSRYPFKSKLVNYLKQTDKKAASKT
jgi:hypothetical protein